MLQILSSSILIPRLAPGRPSHLDGGTHTRISTRLAFQNSTSSKKLSAFAAATNELQPIKNPLRCDQARCSGPLQLAYGAPPVAVEPSPPLRFQRLNRANAV